MKISTVALITLLAFILGFVLGAVIQKKFRPCINIPVVTVKTDTLVTHDTIINKVPVPVKEEVIRYDTVTLQISPDSIGEDGYKGVVKPDTIKDRGGVTRGQNGDVVIPITQKTYKTDDYKAVVAGFRPSLVSMELYPKVKTITREVTKVLKPRWSLTVGPGLSYWDNKIAPSVSLTAGLVIWSK